MATNVPMAWIRMIPEERINQVAGYYPFVNRLADGLGVELERIHREDGPL